jgi:hypothetical protein
MVLRDMAMLPSKMWIKLTVLFGRDEAVGAQARDARDAELKKFLFDALESQLARAISRFPRCEIIAEKLGTASRAGSPQGSRQPLL